MSFHLVKIRLDFTVEHNLKILKTNNKVVRTLVKDNDKDDDRSLCLLSSHDGMKYYSEIYLDLALYENLY